MAATFRKRAPLRVLIVDDEPLTREVVRETLELEDFELSEAADGFAALERAHAWLPDVVVLDVMMPGMDGFDVCRALRGVPGLAGAVVVMVTAKAQPEDRMRGIEAGADRYLTKPFSPLQLIDTIREATASGRRNG